jgi:hypothetical protein
MDITLYEKVNKQKLNEVLVCDNIPGDNIEWKQKLKTLLTILNKKKLNKQGIEVKYKQKYKYGRYNTNCGLQLIQKDIRKYISGEFYYDLDFVNCHPVILNQLLKNNNAELCFKNNIVNEAMSYLDEYIINRESFLKTNNLTKIDIIKMINNEEFTSKPILKQIHNQIYTELLPVLIKNNKQVYTRIKRERIKDKKDYNHNGSFIAHYLQNIENNMLMILYNRLNEKGFIVGSLMFDGLLVESNNVDVNELKKELDECKKLIKENLGYDIDIVFKSTETDWIPNIPEMVNLNETELNYEDTYNPKTNINLYTNCFKEDIDGKKYIDEDEFIKLVKYLNRYICMVNKPKCFGWRDNVSDNFVLIKSLPLDRIRRGLGVNLNWLDSDIALKYDKFDFIVDESELKPGIYNTYTRPKMIKIEDSLENISPKFYEYLKVMSDSNSLIFEYLINYISKMFQVGMTKQTLVLMGEKGTGKSSFGDILATLIGYEYYTKVDDITHLSNNFNSIFEKSIITVIEEVVSNAGEYHSVQSKLKSLTTDKPIRIEKKGIDSYMSSSNNNFIICTNECNPVKITKDNRRYMVIKMPNTLQNNNIFFRDLKLEVKENIEKIRYYFYKYKYIEDLNSIRPTTDAEKELMELNKSPVQEFLVEYDYKDIPLSIVYEYYREFCKNNNYKSTSSKYFSTELKKFGLETIRIYNKKTKTKDRYIIKIDEFGDNVITEIDKDSETSDYNIDL